MRIIDWPVELSCKNDIFHLYAISDPHIGNIAFDKKSWEESIQQIRDDPLSAAIINGDLLDLIIGQDRRFDPDTVDPDFLLHGAGIVDAQEQYAIDSLWPIRKQIILIHSGNHDETFKCKHYRNITKRICESLGVEYGTYTAFVRLIFRRYGDNERMKSRVIKGRSSHGCGTASTKGGILNKLHNLMKSFDADFFVQGHTHRRVCDMAPILSVPSSGKAKLVQEMKGFASTGSFFQTYKLDVESSYGERKDYPPGDIGGVLFEFVPFNGGIKRVEPMV